MVAFSHDIARFCGVWPPGGRLALNRTRFVCAKNSIFDGSGRMFEP